MEGLYRILEGAVLLGGAGLLLGTTAGAQTPLYDINGDAQYDRLGVSLAQVGDVNNDGSPDVAMGATEDFLPFVSGPGYVKVISGADGSVLHHLVGVAPAGEFGYAVAGVGDIDQDGHDDVIVGAPEDDTNGSGSGTARIYSGASGSQFRIVQGDTTSFKCGTSVEGVGDVDGDSIPDYAVGSRGAGLNGQNSGVVRIYSGLSGFLLSEMIGVETGDRLGASMDNVGDVDGDGIDDLLVGSYYGGVYLYSGVDGSLIRDLPSSSDDDFYGWDVAGAGDVSGDGVPDFLIGAHQDSVFTSLPGYVDVVNGATGASIRTLSGTVDGERFGISVSSAGDFDGDGVPDFLVGADQNSGNAVGYAQVYSGFDGALLQTYVGSGDDAHLGLCVEGLGDINGNQKPDIAVGQPGDDVTGLAAGSVQIYEGDPTSCGQITNYCTSLPNSTGGPAFIFHTGSSSIASNDLILLVMGAAPNQSCLFFYGANPIQVPFGNGIRCVGGKVYRLPVVSTGPAGTTAWAFDNTNPSEPGGQVTPGSTWYFQNWFRDPAAGGSQHNLSDGLRVPFCP